MGSINKNQDATLNNILPHLQWLDRRYISFVKKMFNYYDNYIALLPRDMLDIIIREFMICHPTILLYSIKSLKKMCDLFRITKYYIISIDEHISIIRLDRRRTFDNRFGFKPIISNTLAINRLAILYFCQGYHIDYMRFKYDYRHGYLSHISIGVHDVKLRPLFITSHPQDHIDMKTAILPCKNDYNILNV